MLPGDPYSPQVTSKKGQILELSAAGLHNREIAAKVGSSPVYVAKVKSEAKRRALQARAPAVLPYAKPIVIAGGTNLGIHHLGSSLSGRSQTAITNLKETDENVRVRKELWGKFAQKMPNVEIIKETGLNPGNVLYEFEYFLRFLNRDAYALQKGAIDYLANCIGEVPDLKEFAEPCQKLVDHYGATGYLTNTEFFELLRLLSRIGYESGIDAVASRNVRPPKGWIKPPCSVCGKPMGALVVNPSAKIGQAALTSVSRYFHGQCKKEKDLTIPQR
jgi:hypothetical protein